MVDKRIKRKVVWEKAGVSEIIGTILMLSITVVLFSSIITFVGNMPAPRQTFVVELKCSLANWDGSNSVDFRILHQGGQVMDDLFTYIYLSVDDTPITLRIDPNLRDTNGDGDWGVGEYWVYTIWNSEVNTLNPASKFSVTIVDTERNTLIWQETLGEGVNIYRPIIKRLWIDSDLVTPEVDDPGPIGFSKDFKIYAEIVDPEGIGGENGLNTSNIWVNLSSIYGPLSAPIQMNDTVDSRDADDDNIYVAICTGPEGTGAHKIPVGYYFFMFNATDNTGLEAQRAEKFPVGMIVGEKPQIVVKGNDPDTDKYEFITFSNPEPTNGETVTITSTILNLGGAGAYVDVWFYLDDDTSQANLINRNWTGDSSPDPVIVLVPQLGQQDAKLSWVATPGGVHMIIVKAEVNASYHNTAEFFDPDLSDNTNYTNISVMPKILLVDDDAHVNDLSNGDTVSFMRAALSTADFNYDFVVVGAGDGPGYDYGDYPLKNYDVVIWMTGYTTTSTLTTTANGDVANLQKFLKPTTTDNGGSLWLISQGFWGEAIPGSPLDTFAKTYLHVPDWSHFVTEPLPDMYGNATHPVTDGFSSVPIDTIIGEGTGNVHYWDYNAPLESGARVALRDFDNPSAYALSYNSTANPADPIEDSRILSQTWGFSRIADTATQTQYAYKAILWLGNITMKFSQDVAISEQTVDPKNVFYKQEVTIRFVVRNNGLSNYTIDDNLYFLLRITDMDGIDVKNDVLLSELPSYQRIDYLNTTTDNTRTIEFVWIPQEIGYHRITIEIDPYNYIEESNELNNEISSYWGTGELNVQYRVLVVDDDESHESLSLNETGAVTEALDYLEYEFENYTVDMNADGPAFSDGVDRPALNEYNAVIWVAGEALNPFTTFDMENITSYMGIGGSFWLIGNGLWTGTDETIQPFEADYLKIGSVDGDAGLGANTILMGIEDDDVSHGMEYACNGDPDADAITAIPDGVEFTYQNDTIADFNSVRYHGELITNPDVEYRAATTAWLLSSLDSNYSRAEFVFMMLRWFDKPEERIETRISNIDVWISDEHPQLGSGYVIQATVQNTGGETGNVLVRFMDGDTQIGSDSISVSPGGETTAEIIWVPLFSGERTIRVLLDPIAEVPEIFEWSNNIASRQIYVYFFWDDMESGTGKWSHSSTIALINGEQPLEYFGTTPLTVNIEKNWDYALSTGIDNCTDPGFYHTYDRAFWLQEPAGSTTVIKHRGPMDVVFALDNSGSMAGTPLTNLKTATRKFIANLTLVDRAAIWVFTNDADPVLLRGYAYMDFATRASFNTSINGITALGYTPFYDTVGSAIQYSIDNPSTSKAYIIGMTDGVSNYDDVYTPEANWGASYVGTDPQNYANGGDTATGNGFTGGTGYGLINPPVMVFTIGLGINHDPTYPSAPDWSRTAPTADNIGTDNYEIEYDIWHCADSSPIPTGSYGWDNTTLPGVPNVGHYYYTNNPTQLGAIFEEIFSSIIIGDLEGEEQTRSSVPGPTTTAITSYTYNAITSPSATHKASYCDVDAMPPTGGNLNSQTEATTVQYGQIATSNGVRWETPNPGNGDEVFMMSMFNIAESPATITQISFNFDGQCDVAADFGIWATNGAWAQVGATQAAAADTDVVFTRSVTGAGCAAYIIGGVLTWGVYSDASWQLSRIDLLSVDITWESAPYITNTVPVSGGTDIAVTANIVITFSEQINPTTFSYSVTPDPGGWGTAWSGGGTIVTLTHANFAPSTSYTVTVISAEDMTGNALIAGAVPNPWTFTTTGPPVITATAPADGAIDVPLTSTVVVTFSKAMNTGSVTYTCVPAVTVWSVVWSAGNTVATYSHTNNFASNTLYTFRITAGTDTLGNALVAGVVSNPWTFTSILDTAPYISTTTPVSGAVNVLATQNVIITFNEAMSTGTVTYSITPNPGGLVAVWSGGNTILTISHNNFFLDTQYTVQVLTGQDTTGNALASGTAPNPWTFRTQDLTPPTITITTPSSGSTGVGTGQPIIITFSEAMDTASAQAAFSCVANPGGWTFTWNMLKTELTAKHYDLNQMTAYTCSVSSTAEDLSGNNLAAGAVPNPWTFTTGTGGGGSSTPGLAPDGANTNKSAVTRSMDLRNTASANLEFWHKYNMVPGANGGVLMLGFYNETAAAWQYKYVVPSSAYTGNLRLNATDRVDSFNTFMQWGWNGISGRGTFTWEKVSLNILPFLDEIPDTWLDQVRVKFQYYQYGGGTGYGWYIDDVRVTVSRSNDVSPGATTADVWRMIDKRVTNPLDAQYHPLLGTNHTHSGNYAWWNGDPVTGLMKPGIDNYLMTMPVDLTNARIAYLSAYMKFNLNYASGAPPDGFRIEITTDNGVSWVAVNLGVRSAWNVSGTGGDADDGYPGDGKSYTGLNEGNYWVSAGSLTRVNIDLSSFSGHAIQIRFRVVTNYDAGYAHSNNANQVDPGFGGFYLDDVQVKGETILG